MSAIDNFNNYIANVGAGYDAAGRLSFAGGAGNMYASPNETANMQNTLAKLKQNAMAEDPRGMLIRDLLDQLDIARNRGTVRVPVFPLAAGGNTSIQYHGR